MRLQFHGGMCCGIKHIRHFPQYTTTPMQAVASQNKHCHDQYGHSVNSELDFFTDAAPAEPATERLDRLIKFCDKNRPQGIIEAVLAKGTYMDQVKTWETELKKRRFILVNECKNSNSNNTIFVYHRNKE